MSYLKPYKDRAHAGKKLARALQAEVDDPQALVLALPRGGVPVGAALAGALGLALDILLVRKIGMPGHEEYAIGAVGSGGVTVLERHAVQESGLAPEAIDALCASALQELTRRARHYRGARPWPVLRGRTVVLVDDGIATGASMRAALEVVSAGEPGRVVIAAPVGAPDSCAALAPLADALVCPLQPPHFHAVGRWYRQFEQTADDEVVDLLIQAWREDGA